MPLEIADKRVRIDLFSIIHFTFMKGGL